MKKTETLTFSNGILTLSDLKEWVNKMEQEGIKEIVIRGTVELSKESER